MKECSKQRSVEVDEQLCQGQATAGKRGNVLKPYSKMFETIQFGCTFVLSGLTARLEHGGFETHSGI